jgi:uncharacterized protein
MSMPLIVELRRFCEESRTLEAAFSPTQLPRLLDSVADTAGGVSVQVRGWVDARDRPCLDIRMTGQLQVLCQRCMRPMPVDVDVGQTLAFGEEGAEESADPESVEVLPPMSHVDLAELAEEELLLSLPMLPRHQDCDLPGPAGVGKETPFAALKGLLGDAGEPDRQD